MRSLGSFQSLDFPGAALRRGDGHYLVRLDTPVQFLSSAPLGDGWVYSRWVLSQQVSINAVLPDPEASLRERASLLGIPEGETLIGLLTAVDHRDLQVCSAAEEDVTVTTLATVGIANASSPRQKNVGSYDNRNEPGKVSALQPGTINLLTLVDANLSAGALVRASTMATEAKTLALVEAGVKTPQGYTATGTSTDVTVVGHSGRGRYFKYAGSATLVGWLVARTAYHAVGRGLEAYNHRRFRG